MKAFRLVQFVFSIAGAVLLVLALYLGLETQRFMGTALTADGTVIALLLVPSSHDRSTYRPEVTYIDSRGTTRTFESQVSNNPPDHRLGEHVTVLYDPSQATLPRIRNFMHLWGAATIAGALGATFLSISTGVALYRRHKALIQVRLREHGRAIEASIQAIEQDETVSINGRHPFIVLCQWRNPLTQELHLFRSENLPFDPTVYLKRRQVRVFIAPENPRRYLVDLSFLPASPA